MNAKTANSVKPRLAKTWLVLTDPCTYDEKVANKIRFWLASTTKTPNRKPTEKLVGNRFSTKVPKTPNAKCTIPVQTDARTRATDPSFVFKLTTVSYRVMKGKNSKPFR